ncbi:helix-turn-helix domain-containing protein [Stenotrophomonas nitritireducens]|uniref:helix-turn-helix domain-containing protein n=1 Tax=Stenotrophomonas nitritireducens TaxID=83617 RepID=UPI003D954C37
MKIDANRIRTLREARGWSQEHLAAVAGLSARTVQRLEAEGKASHESRMAVAAALEADSVQLLQADTPPQAASASMQNPSHLEKIIPWAMLFLLALAWFGYSVGKDLAVRDNSRCADNPVQCKH